MGIDRSEVLAGVCVAAMGGEGGGVFWGLT